MKIRFISTVLIFFLFSTLSLLTSVASSDNVLNEKEVFLSKEARKGVVLGLLSTKKETFNGEYRNPKLLMEMFRNFGVKVVIIDYNTIVNFDLINKKVKDIVQKKQLIYNKVNKFIVENRINRILIPGNYYNISSNPLPPTANRQNVTDALVQIVDNDPSIHLLGICGGLQGIMVSRGVEVIRVEKIIGHLQSGESDHVSALPHPINVSANLHKIILKSNSRLAGIARRHMHNYHVNKKESILLYCPDYHYEAINNTLENMQKLSKLGYKVVAYSEDGIIESIEDKYGNIYFQCHPEYLALDAEEKYTDDRRKNAAIDVSIAILEDFLYRK